MSTFRGHEAQDYLYPFLRARRAQDYLYPFLRARRASHICFLEAHEARRLFMLVETRRRNQRAGLSAFGGTSASGKPAIIYVHF